MSEKKEKTQLTFSTKGLVPENARATMIAGTVISIFSLLVGSAILGVGIWLDTSDRVDSWITIVAAIVFAIALILSAYLVFLAQAAVRVNTKPYLDFAQEQLDAGKESYRIKVADLSSALPTYSFRATTFVFRAEEQLHTLRVESVHGSRSRPEQSYLLDGEKGFKTLDDLISAKGILEKNKRIEDLEEIELISAGKKLVDQDLLKELKEDASKNDVRPSFGARYGSLIGIAAMAVVIGIVASLTVRHSNQEPPETEWIKETSVYRLYPLSSFQTSDETLEDVYILSLDILPSTAYYIESDDLLYEITYHDRYEARSGEVELWYGPIERCVNTSPEFEYCSKVEKLIISDGSEDYTLVDNFTAFEKQKKVNVNTDIALIAIFGVAAIAFGYAFVRSFLKPKDKSEDPKKK